jgi:hypothetical protein
MMQNLLSLHEACERYSKTTDGFYSSAFLLRKKYGEFPKWYVQDSNDAVYINTYEYERYADLERKAWMIATNDLYYILTYDYGCTDWQIAKFMARHSNKYTNLPSWSSFISKALFSLPAKTVLEKRLSMCIEFVLSGGYMINTLMNDEKSAIVFKDLPQIS